MVVIFGLTTLHSQENHETKAAATESPHYSHLPSLLPDPIIIQSFSLTRISLAKKTKKIWCLSPASDAATNPPSIIIVSSSLLVLIRLHHRSGLGMESAAGLSLFLRLKN